MSMPVATSAATRSGRRTAACAAYVAPNENPAMNGLAAEAVAQQLQQCDRVVDHARRG